MLAERETNDRLIAHFLADRIGATFDGRVSGVHRAGLFVKLHETGADGFVPARTIGDEYFRYDEAGHAMVGARSGETYRLGDPRHRQAGGSRPRCRRPAFRAFIGRARRASRAAARGTNNANTYRPRGKQRKAR